MGSKATIEVVPSALSAMSSTMMPFLYQTRTLAGGLRWSRGSTAVGFRISPTKNRRDIHYSCRRSEEESQHPDHRRAPSSNPNPEPNQDQLHHDSSEGRTFQGVRFFPANDSKYTSRENIDRSTRGAFGRRGSGSFIVRRTTTGDGDQAPEHVDGIPFDSSEIDWRILPSSTQPKEIEDLTRNIPSEPSKARETTITVAERHTFQRIFSDIFARSQRSGADGTVPRNTFSEIPVPLDQRESAKSKLNAVLLGGTQLGRSSEEIMQAIDQFPPALRAAAASSLGLSTELPRIGEDKETMHPDPLEHLREPERERVEALMRAANTDFELWAVMEKEVFSLVDKMGLQEQEEEVVAKPKKKGKMASNKKKATTDESSETAPSAKDEGAQRKEEERKKQEEEARHQLALLGPLYPSHLLLGMRLLDRSFAKPSSLTLTLLPKIKSMGVISHVLGASTALYNELLRIYWFQHDNFTGVLELLNEMEEAGLDHDAETLEIVNDISNVQARVQRGERGATLKTLWTFPEYAPNEFADWRQKIQHSVADLGQHFGR